MDEFAARCPYLPQTETDALLARWREPHRRHHDVRHLTEMLDALRFLADTGVPFVRRPVVLATWFHDAIYDPAAPDNEEQSARHAGTVLAGDDDVTEIQRLIRATADHRVEAADHNGIALSDADLSILGADSHRYALYAAAVREEYAMVPDAVFGPARADILERLLADGTIYRSDAARSRWEDSARRNVADEIERLRMMV